MTAALLVASLLYRPASCPPSRGQSRVAIGWLWQAVTADHTR